MKKGQIIECEIDSLAFGGAGVARVMVPAHDGTPEREFVVFVDKAVPGDKVKAQIVKRKKKYAEAMLVEVVEPSELRISPRCRYFGNCGGCKMQQVSYEKQLEFKQQQVQDSIERLGGFKGFKVEKIIGCEENWYYRNKMEFSFSWEKDPRRLAEGEEPVLSIGLHPPKKFLEVVDIEECFLQSELSVKLINELREFVRAQKWTPYHFRLGTGFVRSLFVREGKWTGEVMINLVVNAAESEPMKESIEDFVKLVSAYDEVVSVYLSRVRVEEGRRTTVEEELMYGKETLGEEIRLEKSGKSRKGGVKVVEAVEVVGGGKLKFDILPQAFFQPNTKQAGVLYSQIFRFADVDEKSVVFDLFCGTGTIGLFCAQRVGQVYGIELNESAVENARANAKLNELTNVEFVVGDVGKVVGQLDDKPDLIVMDPPRAGVGEGALEKVLKFESPQIVYVSCNPTTLARDLRFLCDNGYELKAVQPVDMFPQTGHIECVASLVKAIMSDNVIDN